jgi:hypothetical protein
MANISLLNNYPFDFILHCGFDLQSHEMPPETTLGEKEKYCR